MSNATITTTPALPPLDDFTRDELVHLIRILHGGLVRAQADFTQLAATTAQAIDIAVTAIEGDRQG